MILFDDAPDHHVGMYLMPVGDRTVLVGDPRLGEPLFCRGDFQSPRPVGPVSNWPNPLDD